MFPTTAPDSLVLYKWVLSSKSLRVAITELKYLSLSKETFGFDSHVRVSKTCHTTHIKPRKNTSVHK